MRYENQRSNPRDRRSTDSDKPKRPAEENAIVLDFLKHGYASHNTGHRPKDPIAQAIGKNHLTLLEIVPKKEVFLQPQEEVYVGEGKRDQIHHIKGRIPISKLTSTAAAELKHAIEKIVEEDETRFINFFNKAGPLSMRMHSLEILPGLGKKHMWEIIDQRKFKAFESFDDIKSRVKLMPNPKGIVIKRIIKELEGKEKYNIFVK